MSCYQKRLSELRSESEIEIPEEAYRAALVLLELLPSCFPEPEIEADPRGMIGLEWFGKIGQRVVVTIPSFDDITAVAIFEGKTVIRKIALEEDVIELPVFPTELFEMLLNLMQE